MAIQNSPHGALSSLSLSFSLCVLLRAKSGSPMAQEEGRGFYTQFWPLTTRYNSATGENLGRILLPPCVELEHGAMAQWNLARLLVLPAETQGLERWMNRDRRGDRRCGPMARIAPCGGRACATAEHCTGG
jgi:hypothetical protein